MPTMTNKELFYRNLSRALSSKLHVKETNTEPFPDDRYRGYLKVTFEVIEAEGKDYPHRPHGTLVESVPVQIPVVEHERALTQARIQAVTRLVSVIEQLQECFQPSSHFSDAVVIAWKPGVRKTIEDEFKNYPPSMDIRIP